MIHVWRKRALGITLWKWHNFLLELWFILPGTVLPPHSHPNIDTKFRCLFGNNIIVSRVPPGHKYPDRQYLLSMPHDIWTALTVPAGYLHYFTVGRLPFIFLNFEHWLTKPTSAAIDFKE